jgi:hypothetical protein
MIMAQQEFIGMCFLISAGIHHGRIYYDITGYEQSISRTVIIHTAKSNKIHVCGSIYFNPGLLQYVYQPFKIFIGFIHDPPRHCSRWYRCLSPQCVFALLSKYRI